MSRDGKRVDSDEARFEAEALAAWKEYQLTRECVIQSAIDEMFVEAIARAKAIASGHGT